MRSLSLLASLLFLAVFSRFASASLWRDSLDGLSALVVKRQGDSSDTTTGDSKTTATTSAATTTPSDDNNSDSSTQTTTTGSSQTNSATNSNSNTASDTGSNSGKTSATKTTNTAKKTTTFDPRLPAGGVAMITPNVFSPSSYYKIGDNVTFAWNYTSLSVTPTAIDILASCAANQQTYTIAANQSVTNATGSVTWDTRDFQASNTVQLLTETYTLIIHDAAKDVTALPSAGYLAAFTQFRFGMYLPQPYKALNDGYQCVTCGAGVTSAERQTLAVILGTAGVAVVTCSLFAGAWGVF